MLLRSHRQLPDITILNKKKKAEELVKELNSLNKKEKCEFALYLFDNASNSHTLTKKLSEIKPFDARQIRIAMLVGESRILSLIPVFCKLGIDVVLLNDVQPFMRIHIEFMLECLRKTNSIEEFLTYYKTNHPLKNKLAYDFHNYAPLSISQIDDERLFGEEFKSSLMGKHLEHGEIVSGEGVLSSPKQFKLCKEKLELGQLKFAFSNTDLFNMDECIALENTLKRYKATVEILNVNNLKVYDEHDVLQKTTDRILSRSIAPHVMFQHSKSPYKGKPLISAVRTKESFFQALDLERKRGDQAKLYIDYTTQKLNNLVAEANKYINQIALKNGFHDASVIPQITWEEVGEENKFFVKCLLTPQSRMSQYRAFNSLRNQILQEINPLKYSKPSELPKPINKANLSCKHSWGVDALWLEIFVESYKSENRLKSKDKIDNSSSSKRKEEKESLDFAAKRLKVM